MLQPKPHRATSRRSPLRLSTPADIEAIHNWVSAEKARGLDGNFLGNWKQTLKAHRERKLLVYVDPQTDLPIGYQWGGLIEPGILQVKHEMRGRGIGRQLVEHRIAQARRKEQDLLYIECQPATSIPFWQKMGFKLLPPANGKQYAYQILEKALALPPHGSPVDIEIRFYPEATLWEPTTPAVVSSTPKAFAYADGVIRLAERVHSFDRLYPELGDAVVEILLNGKPLFKDKAKRESAASIGVRRCPSLNGYFIDRIHSRPSGTPQDGQPY